MTSNLITKAAEAIRSAIDTEDAYADLARALKADWLKAYAASKAAAENGASQEDIGKAAKVSATTVGDYITAATLDPVAWDTLAVLPRKVNRPEGYTTLHSLVAAARKKAGTKAVRAVIAEAWAKVRNLPAEPGHEPDATRVAKVWGTAVRAIHALTVKAAEPKPEASTEAAEVTTEAATVSTTEAAEPPTLDARVARLAGECAAVRDALSGGAAVAPEALTALLREAGMLARDVADILSTASTARATA